MVYHPLFIGRRKKPIWKKDEDVVHIFRKKERKKERKHVKTQFYQIYKTREIKAKRNGKFYGCIKRKNMN